MNIIIQGEVLNRASHNKEPFFHSCRDKREFLKQVGAVYDSVKEVDTLSIKILIRKANNNEVN
jgi:hypothetical protein